MPENLASFVETWDDMGIDFHEYSQEEMKANYEMFWELRQQEFGN